MLLTLILTASLSASVPAPAPKLKVVTTLGVLASLAREVGGDYVEAQALANPQQDPHFVQPRPTLMEKARSADVFVELGMQLELWAQKVVEGSGNPRIQPGQPARVVASTGVTALELPRELSREWGDDAPTATRTSGSIRSTPRTWRPTSSSVSRPSIPPTRSSTRRISSATKRASTKRSSARSS
ncbi:MAG: zinc ABC transporter substrate-binding protein [Planctomycetes bacterium]|nr:zinc ABC transporter substrate-binding protein [Planctomycetota bacterium]